jgi:DNA repair exonuclease SbcCD ATPase subunit
MSKVTEDLKKIVDQVAREGALTPDAIKQFDKMRENLEDAESELKQVREQRDRALAESQERHKTITVLDASLKVRIEEIDKLHKREHEFDRQQWLYYNEVERRLEMRGIISDMFKNFELTRMFTKNTMVPGPPAYSGGPATFNNQSESHIETERHAPEKP